MQMQMQIVGLCLALLVCASMISFSTNVWLDHIIMFYIRSRKKDNGYTAK